MVLKSKMWNLFKTRWRIRQGDQFYYVETKEWWRPFWKYQGYFLDIASAREYGLKKAKATAYTEYLEIP